MNYYNKHAKEYINNTKNVDMKEYYDIFESYLKPNVKILDVGFGSGRDSLYFKNKGYEVVSIDPIKEFCDNARSIGLDNVIQMSIEDIKYDKEFDGIWACASLLHLKSNKLVDAFNKCYNALKENGVMYVSFKYGDFEGIIDDRYFTYLAEETFTNIINQTNFKIDKLWINKDKLNRGVKWLNVIIKGEI
ncbi:MAG: class I SAM-dependent methyltransferase [Bacilli bacterium]|nr:class I SAM-dependent methyltransferase [Bacilli bacterium]